MSRRYIVWILVVGVASVVCWQAAQSAPRDDEDAEMYRLFVDAVEHVGHDYVKEVDRRKLIEAAITGMLDSLDPYSNYISPEELPQFNKTTTGKFGGVGVQIDMNNDQVKVISPMVGAPAYNAGVLAGDRILKVDGQPLKGLTSNQVIDKISGPAGTKITLTIQHEPYDADPIDVTIERGTINVESVLGVDRGKEDAWNFFIDANQKIGYVRLNSFTPDTAKELRAVLEKLLSEGMKGLILDLRYNPGGLLPTAIEVSDSFVSTGKIVSIKKRNNTEQQHYAHREGTLPDFPVVVLVNRFSASASEIVAACLQDHERAVIIGERTWGKGSVQNVIDLEDGKSALKLTTASYHRPNGHNIHRFKDSKEEDEWGVKPNEGNEVKFSTEEHQLYARWRADRDRAIGKVSPEERERREEARKTARFLTKQSDAPMPSELDEPAKEDKPKDAKDEKPKDAKDEKSKDSKGEQSAEKADASPMDEAAKTDEAPPKDFDDRQLDKALEVVRQRIAEGPKQTAEQ